MRPFFIGLFILFAINTNASEREARESYLMKNYTQAKNQYLELVKTSPNNFSNQYNLAASYYRLNEPILAKIHFLKALKLMPNDQDTKLNIELINKKLIDQQFLFDGHWPFLFQLNIRSVLVIMLIISCIILAMLFKNKQHQYSALKRLGLVAFVIWSGLFLLTVGIHHQLSHYGVVIAKKTKIFSGPSTTQTALFFVHEGAEYKVIKVSKNWAKVQFPNGLKGWIPGNEVVHI